MKKQVIEITTFTEQSLTFYASGMPRRRWCSICGAAVWMMTPDQAATVAGVCTRAIFRWIEEGHLHFVETADGRVLICPASAPLQLANYPPLAAGNEIT